VQLGLDTCVQRGQVDAAVLAVYEQELNEPMPEAVQALAQLIDSGNRISAEITAQMMEQDYPSSASARDCLARVMGMEAVNVTWARSRPLVRALMNASWDRGHCWHFYYL
jgi:hypothetical protein